jgi:hypothetical protein
MIDFGEEHAIFIYLIIVVVVNFGQEGVFFFFLLQIFLKKKSNMGMGKSNFQVLGGQ